MRKLIYFFPILTFALIFFIGVQILILDIDINTNNTNTNGLSKDTLTKNVKQDTSYQETSEISETANKEDSSVIKIGSEIGWHEKFKSRKGRRKMDIIFSKIS